MSWPKREEPREGMHTASSIAEPKVSLLGTLAVLFEAPGAFDLTQQQRIWALADIVGDWPDVLEAVPGVTNLMVAWREAPREFESGRQRLLAAWERAAPKQMSGRTIEVPVVYGGSAALDMAAVAEHTGLDAREIVDIHSRAEYTVCAVGSAPGFAYLHGLDPRLTCPRKAIPTLRVPAGAVSIGGMQTGVSVVASPNGWNVIGRASVSMFDLARPSPSLLSAGDKVRFVVERIEA
jgi:KipI family sensor histidine kinase inhibitor